MVVNDRKRAYFERLVSLMEDFTKLLIVEANNVGSKQLQLIRRDLRGKAVILMGKNTLVKKAIKLNVNKFPGMEQLLPYVKGNIGFVFVKDDLREVREIILNNKVSAPAKPGAISPLEVEIPAGNTGMEPTKTSFFQALNIPTKITRGCVDILSNMTILHAGEKVGNSEAALLQMLNIRPFFYGLKVLKAYDDIGVFGADLLDITNDDVECVFRDCVGDITALAMGMNYPAKLTVPIHIMKGFQNLLSVAVSTEYSFPQAQDLKDLLSDPEALAAAQAAAQASTGPAESTEAVEEEAAPEEEEEESDEDMGFGLFD